MSLCSNTYDSILSKSVLLFKFQCSLLRIQPMHDDYDIRQEQLNKASIMSSKSFLQSLLDMFKNHVVGCCCCGTKSISVLEFCNRLRLVAMHCMLSCCVQLRNSGALVIAAMLDFMTFALCAPYSETTDGTYFDVFLDMVATEGRAIFKLFQVRPHLIGLVFIRSLSLVCVTVV